MQFVLNESLAKVRKKIESPVTNKDSDFVVNPNQFPKMQGLYVIG